MQEMFDFAEQQAGKKAIKLIDKEITIGYTIVDERQGAPLTLAFVI